MSSPSAMKRPLLSLCFRSWSFLSSLSVGFRVLVIGGLDDIKKGGTTLVRPVGSPILFGTSGSGGGHLPGLLRSLGKSPEAFRVVDGYLRQHLAVHLDPALPQA